LIKRFISGKDNSTQAFWVALGSFSNFSLAIVSAAILSRYLEKDAYGTYRQIVYVYISLQAVFSVGVPSAYAYFLPRYSTEEGSAIAAKLTRVLLLLGLIFSIILFVSADLVAWLLKNPELSTGLKYFSIVPILLLPTLGLDGLFSTYRRTIWLAIYNTLTRLILLASIVLPVILIGSNYLYAIYGWIAASFLSLLIALYFKRIPFKNTTVKTTHLSVRAIFSYSLPLFYAQLAGISIAAADQFFISRYFGVQKFAEFSNGFQQIPLVPMITGAAATVLMPIFSRLQHHEATTDEVLRYWRGALRKSAILIYPMVIFCIFYARDIVIFLYSETYEASALFFQISMLVNFFNIVVFAPLLLAFGKTKDYARAHIVYAVLIWIAEYIAVKTFRDPYLIAGISIGAKIILVIYFLQYSARLLGTSMQNMIPGENILRLLIHGFLAAAVCYTITAYLQWPILASLILAGGLFSGILLLTGSFFRLNYLEFLLPMVKGKTV
jgi:O-antigen/teichoic acid export membrane protein